MDGDDFALDDIPVDDDVEEVDDADADADDVLFGSDEDVEGEESEEFSSSSEMDEDADEGVLEADDDKLPVGSPRLKASKPKPMQYDIPEAWCRKMMKAYFHKHGFMRHQLESYNKFMYTILPEIVAEHSKVVVESEDKDRKHVFELSNVKVNLPSMKEDDGVIRLVETHEAQKRGLTYASRVVVDIKHEVYDGQDHLMETRLYEEALLAKVSDPSHYASYIVKCLS